MKVRLDVPESRTSTIASLDASDVASVAASCSRVMRPRSEIVMVDILASLENIHPVKLRKGGRLFSTSEVEIEGASD